MKLMAGIAVTATVLTLLSYQAFAQTMIGALPYVISAPGTYLLGKSLAFPPGQRTQNGITVNASNVTIDLNGFYLAEAPNPVLATSFGIYAFNRANITVKNGSIVGFYEGIGLEYSSGPNVNTNHLIDGVRFTNQQAVGIELGQTTNSLIQNCAFSNTGYDANGNVVSGTGIAINVFASPGSGNTLSNNRVTHSLKEGIVTRGGQGFGGSYLEGNVVSQCPKGYDLAQDDKYRNNTTISCQTPFSANGATDLGGNN